MLYLYFLSSDATTESWGTTIQYVDTKTGVGVSEYGNILGAIPISTPSVLNGLVPFYYKNDIVFYFVSLSSSSSVLTSAEYDIRVYYY